MSINKVMLIGNICNTPEIRTTQTGKKIVNITIATNEKWKDKTTGEKKEKAEYHRVVIFNEGLCGVVEKYVKKGSKIYVEGQLQTRKWTDNNGVERYSTEVVLQGFNGSLLLLDSKNSSGFTGEVKEESNPDQFASDVDDDIIPF